MGAGGPMKPRWWQLYGLGVLLVALVGAIEVGVSPGALRTILESAAVVLGFGLMLLGAVTIGSRWSWRTRPYIKASTTLKGPAGPRRHTKGRGHNPPGP